MIRNSEQNDNKLNSLAMNFIITLLQVLLGLWCITGGLYMSTHSTELITPWAHNFFPGFFWILLGAVEVLFGLGLTLSALKKFRHWTKPAAVGLGLISLLGLGIYTSYSGFPGLLWGLLPALLFFWLAYARSKH